MSASAEAGAPTPPPPEPSVAHAASADAAALVETHLSVLVFVGERAYKLKKPVAFPFVDLTTREARERLCHREVELNRRLAPDVYEGVADVVGPDGQVCDHLVVMRRMPASRRLATLATRPTTDPGVLTLLGDGLAALVALLARFHADARNDPGRDDALAHESASSEALAAAWRENLDEIRALAPDVFDPSDLGAIEIRSAAWLAGRGPLLERRIAEGWVVDGHGDLQADDVYLLDDGPRVLDCLEFSDAFRTVDVADDLGFLLMDLERLGRTDLAGTVLAGYEAAAGVRLPRSLLRFSMAYRALVRAKVTALRAAQHHPTTNSRQFPATSWRRSDEISEGGGDEAGARALLGECRRHLEAARPRLTLVGGAPGTGKSTEARRRAELDGSDPWRDPPVVLRSDVVRKELAGLASTDRAPAPLDTGLYGSDATERTYDELAVRAARAMAEGHDVIVDATFSTPGHRERLRAVAHDAAAELVEVRCVLAPDLVAERIARRAIEGADPSDVTAEQALVLAGRFAPWPEATELDTSG